MKKMMSAMKKMKDAMKEAEMAFSSYGSGDETESEAGEEKEWGNEPNGNGDVDESYPDSGDGKNSMDDEETAIKKTLLVQKMKKMMLKGY